LTIAALAGLFAAGQAWAQQPAASPAASLAKSLAKSFPIPGKSLGGVVRAAPGMASARLTALNEGHGIEILENAGTSMNGYDWFKIRYGGHVGYQWGGIMCSKSPLGGIYQTCP
jgi:hypothetical protein